MNPDPNVENLSIKRNLTALVKKESRTMYAPLIVVPVNVPCYIIHPESKVKKFWNVILTILLLYTATVMPYKISFIDVKWGDTWFYFDLVIDSLFFTDFLINCVSSYYDSDD
jgi:hypothetical protein